MAKARCPQRSGSEAGRAYPVSSGGGRVYVGRKTSPGWREKRQGRRDMTGDRERWQEAQGEERWTLAGRRGPGLRAEVPHGPAPEVQPRFGCPGSFATAPPSNPGGGDGEPRRGRGPAPRHSSTSGRARRRRRHRSRRISLRETEAREGRRRESLFGPPKGAGAEPRRLALTSAPAPPLPPSGLAGKGRWSRARAGPGAGRSPGLRSPGLPPARPGAAPGPPRLPQRRDARPMGGGRAAARRSRLAPALGSR